MLTPERSLTVARKRKRAGSPAPDRRLHKHARHSHDPAAVYYDSLSRIWLTKGALRELDRRNGQTHQSPLSPPASPSSLLELDNAHAAALRRFARNGGPDLSDLRHASAPSPLRFASLTARLQYPAPALPIAPRDSSRPARERDRSRGQLDQTRGRGVNKDGRTRSALRGRGRRLRSLSRDRGGSARSVPSQPEGESRAPTQSSSPYDENFRQHLIDHNVFPPFYQLRNDGTLQTLPRAHNHDEVLARLRQSRTDLSSAPFTNAAFHKFQVDYANGPEEGLLDFVYSVLEGPDIDRGGRGGRSRLTNLANLISVTLTAPMPDLYYGAHPEEILPGLWNHLSNHIEPSTQKDLPAAPNFFLAAKGPNGTQAVAINQAVYDGATGARAIAALENFAGTPSMDGNIKAISSALVGGSLYIYGVHLAPPMNNRSSITYIVQQLDAYCLTGNLENCRRGLTIFRNAIDWTGELHSAAIAKANAAYSARLTRNTPRLQRESASNISSSSADGLAQEVGPRRRA